MESAHVEIPKLRLAIPIRSLGILVTLPSGGIIFQLVPTSNLTNHLSI